jgi:hypothetical protein
MRLLNLSILRTRNVGDFVSQPVHYFEFPGFTVENADMRDPQEPADVIIYGGGGIGKRFLDGKHCDHEARIKIGWGLGTAIEGQRQVPPPPAWFDMYGSREYDHPGTEHVPCASCMHPALDDHHGAPSRHEFVLYFNYDPKRSRPDWKGPPQNHNEIPMHKAIAFLASGENVVTNSYHGAYWATLLGKKVFLTDPFCSKFYHYQFQPVLLGNRTWKPNDQQRQSVDHYPHALVRARQQNIDFYRRVTDLIG